MEYELLTVKPLAASVVIGVLLSFLVIYLLRPLNTGAVGLVVVLCVGIAGILVAIGRAIFRKKK